MNRLLTLLLVLAVGGCDAIIEPDRAIVIDGVVVEAETGEPLTRVSVRLDKATGGPTRINLAESVTDAKGQYRVERGYNIDGFYRVYATDLRRFELDGPGYYIVDGVNDFPVQAGDHRTIRIEMVWVER